MLNGGIRIRRHWQRHHTVLRRELAEARARLHQLQRNAAARGRDLRAAGKDILLLRSQMAKLTALCDGLPARLANEEARLERLERHDEACRTDLRAAGENIVLLRQQAAELLALYNHLSSSLTPPDLAGVRRHIAGLVERNQEISDDLQERSLRLELRRDPFNLHLTYSLVALLLRLGRAPVPEAPPFEADGAPEPENIGVAGLLGEAGRYAEDGDTIGHHACLWQIVMRYPQSARGWAEYARSLADRHEWEHCRQTARHVLSFAGRPDRATAQAMLASLTTLARNQQIGDLDWRKWLDALPPVLRRHLRTASLLLACGDPAPASARLASLIRRKDLTADDWIAVANVAWEREDLSAAYWSWRRAFEIDLPRTLRNAVIDYGGRLTAILEFTGRDDELGDWLSVDCLKYAGANLIPPLMTPESARHTLKLRNEAIDRGLPSLILITQGKSASVTISSLFNHGFGLVTAVYSLISRRVIGPWLADYERGGACYTTHLIPSARNIELLSQANGTSPIIVIVRDPRQWVVSMAGHLEKYPDQMLPSIRAITSRDAAISSVIEEFFRTCVDWIDGWVEAQRKLPIQFATYEDFVRDRDGFVERCLSLYGGDQRYFDRDAALIEKPGIDYHRRRGAVDEWRQVLSHERVKALNDLIPQRLWDFFGWSP